MVHGAVYGKLSSSVFVLVIGVTAGANVNVQSAPLPGRLQTLVNDANAQFKLAYRKQPAEAQAREEKLNAAVSAWQATAKDATNNELLEQWLRSAIRSSMPGSRAALPAMPQFAPRAAAPKTIRQQVLKPAEVRAPEPARARGAAPEPTPAIEPAADSVEEPAAAPAVEAESTEGFKSTGDPFLDDLQRLEQTKRLKRQK